MKVGDVEVNGEETLYLTGASKTGTRKLPLAADETSMQILLDCLNQYPCESEKDAFLWLNK